MTTLENAKMASLKDKIAIQEVKQVEESVKESFVAKIIKKAKSKKNDK